MGLKVVELGGVGLWVLLQNNCAIWAHNAYMSVCACIGMRVLCDHTMRCVVCDNLGDVMDVGAMSVGVNVANIDVVVVGRC